MKVTVIVRVLVIVIEIVIVVVIGVWGVWSFFCVIPKQEMLCKRCESAGKRQEPVWMFTGRAGKK